MQAGSAGHGASASKTRRAPACCTPPGAPAPVCRCRASARP